MDFAFLKVFRSANDQILEILNHNIIGTPEQSMLYQHRCVPNKIKEISDPYYACLIKQNRIIGTCCFCNRQTIDSGSFIRSFYIRYFSFRDAFRRKQFSEKKPSRLTQLRMEIKTLLNGQMLDTTPDEKFYHYAYVDPRNTRSMELCKEFGFEIVRQYSTIIFNRIIPKQNEIQIDEVTSEQQSSVRALLNDFYKEYNMFSFENLFGNRKYYVIKDPNGKILAGTQVNADHWRILSLPGLSGKIILNTFSYLPYLNRLFNKEYRFLTLEGIYYAQGFEKMLGPLFENLLFKYRLNSAIAVVDIDTELYKTMKSIDLGMVDKLNKEVTGNVICKFSNFSNEERELFHGQPAYISGIDVT